MMSYKLSSSAAMTRKRPRITRDIQITEVRHLVAELSKSREKVILELSSMFFIIKSIL